MDFPTLKMMLTVWVNVWVSAGLMLDWLGTDACH